MINYKNFSSLQQHKKGKEPCLVSRSLNIFLLLRNFVSCYAITFSCCSCRFFTILRPHFWAISRWAIYSCHHDVYNDEMWYDEWWLAQVDRRSREKRDIKEENFRRRKMWWTHKRCITLQKCNKFPRRSPFMMATLRFSACGGIKNCFVAFAKLCLERSCTWKHFYEVNPFWRETENERIDRDTTTTAKGNERTKLKNWIVFEVVFMKNSFSKFFPQKNPKLLAFQHCIKIMVIKRGNLEIVSLSFRLMMFLMGKLVIVKSQKYLFFPEIKIVSSFCSILFLGKMKCVVKSKTWKQTLAHASLVRHTEKFFVVQRNNISHIKIEIKYRESWGWRGEKER